ncbi:methyl-accepting chemotaxis protein [Novosphingobium hassiacum]|uniref:Methyl-accepting chemotaxis protein n=1 Tax=Novosphingobium hassiacum TaxID=173676 RepID=A0A7W5ZVB9_9SPHN|nr:methyl-accepting chemotaxis protein [Novosphingobium hassiacum]MBB3860037.1 methyl-accepting chemotaxis protein [Novosphingobium hassiacum]
MLHWFETQAPIRTKFRVLLIGLTAITGLNVLAIPALMFAPAQSFWLVTLIAVGSTLAVAAALAIAGDRVCRPYVDTVLRLEAMAQGDIQSPIRYTENGDCVGRMTRAMDGFRNTTERAISLEAGQRIIIEQMNQALGRLAQNDLSNSIVEPFPEDCDSLRVNYNQGVASIAATMASISGLAQNVLGGSDEINAASADLAQRNERQAANLQRASAAMNEVTSALATTAAQASEANRSVATAVEKAFEGQDIAASATTSMQEIERSSNEISRIVGLIDGIAFQTNLLALNAGVEAARAGEAGRGFAVVATEVRALAQRCTDAASDIKKLVTASSGAVAQGVTTVERTREVLVELSTRISQINSFITDVAEKTGDQVAQLRDVNASVAEMDQMTQQNAAMVEESAAAARSLAEQANILSENVGAFRMPAETRNRDIRTAPPRAARSRPAPTRATSSLPARAPVAVGQDWDEF